MDLKLDTVHFLSTPSDSKIANASPFESITGKRGNISDSSNKLKKFASATVDSATVDSATLDPLDLKDFFTLEELRGPHLFEGPNEASNKGNWLGSDDEYEDEDEGGGLRKSKRRRNKKQTIKKLKGRKTRIMKNKKGKTRRKRFKRNP